MSNKRRIIPSSVGLEQSTKKFVIYVTVTVTSVIALTVIAVVVAMPVINPAYEVPDTLQNWGGLIIGFYFGTFITLLKDWSRETVEVLESDDD